MYHFANPLTYVSTHMYIINHMYIFQGVPMMVVLSASDQVLLYSGYSMVQYGTVCVTTKLCVIRLGRCVLMMAHQLTW